jgi:hypothetical protein
MDLHFFYGNVFSPHPHTILLLQLFNIILQCTSMSPNYYLSIKILYAFLTSLMRATCPCHLIVSDFMTLIISGADYILWSSICVGFEVLISVRLKMAVFWVVASCSLVEFKGSCCLLHQGDNRPDDGGSKHLWNVGKFLPDYTALQSRRQQSSSLHVWLSSVSCCFIFVW